MKIEKCPMCKKTGLESYLGGQTGQYQCRNCGYLGSLRIQERVTLPKYYRSGFESWLVEFYDTSFTLFFFGYGRRLRERIVHTVPKAAKNVLDLATGTGEVALAIKKRRSNARVVGIDLSKRMLAIASKKAKQRNLDIGWSQQDIGKTKFADKTFDAVTFSFGPHEIPPKHWRTIFHEANRVLAPKGKFIIMDIHKPRDPLFRTGLAVFLRFFEEPYAKEVLSADLTTLLLNAGFERTNKETFLNGLVQLVVGTK